jgi:Flp pilus assembly protein TadB
MYALIIVKYNYLESKQSRLLAPWESRRASARRRTPLEFLVIVVVVAVAVAVVVVVVIVVVVAVVVVVVVVCCAIVLSVISSHSVCEQTHI